MTTPPEQVLAEFIDAWNAGQRPDVAEHLGRVPERQREELARQIDAWLTLGPSPDYDEATLAAIRAEPAVQRALAAARLAQAREDASLSAEQLAQALVEETGLAPEQREKAGRMLAALEAGRLSLAGLSQRLVDALGRILRLPAEAFAASAETGQPGTLAFRADAEPAAEAAGDLELLRRGIEAPSARDWDEVDELFRGGR